MSAVEIICQQDIIKMKSQENKSATLNWVTGDDGIIFTIKTTEMNLPYDQWAFTKITGLNNKPVFIKPLITLIENEKASIDNQQIVHVPFANIASLSQKEIADLCLPPLLPITISLPAPKETISEEGFHLQYRLYNMEGRPTYIEKRTGVIVEVSGSTYTLLDPIFSIIEKIDDSNRKNNTSLDERFLLLGKIKELLPPDTHIDPYLKEINAVFPEGFTIRPFINEHDEVDLDPIPVFFHKSQDEYSPFEDKQVGQPLPPINQDKFSKHFRERNKVNLRYSAGGSWYIIFSEPVRKALEIVHSVQSDTVEKRKQFIRNPRLFIREALDSEYKEELIENIFSEEGYSERVKAVGLWQPKAITWIKKSGEEWLPTDSCGIRLEGMIVHIKPEEISDLITKINEANSLSLDTVIFNDQKIPVNNQVLETLYELTAKVWPDREKSSDSKPLAKEKTVLLIHDQIEQLEYFAQGKVRRCSTYEVPQRIKSSLLPHQISGFRWLQDHWEKGTTGALLADDMGLGKTFTALSFLTWVKKLMESGEYPFKPLLIVAPTGLLKNWQDEHDTHLKSPGIGVLLFAYGKYLRELKMLNGDKGIETLHGIPLLNLSKIKQSDWVLTTYETLRDYQHSFGKVDWAVAVFDEAQKIKNPQAALTDAAKAMKIDFSLALTGTPVENSMSDIWCIMDTVQPGKLGSLREFVHTYDTPQESSASLSGLNRLLTQESKPPMMMRRMKSDHLKELSPIKYHVFEQTMPQSQADAYRLVVNNARVGDKNKGAMLETLNKLRSISLHPAISSNDVDDLYIQDSARLNVLFHVLDSIHKINEKALIFIEYQEMQAHLLSILQRKYDMTSPPIIINGTVNGEKRKERVNIFQSRKGFDVMLLSPRAGGVGLTLTEANHVIHLSRWWNPAVEDQCTDRVYRIGQKREVHVYYPLSLHPEYKNHSFDCRLHALLEKKRNLSRMIMAPTIFSNEDTECLFDETIYGKKITQSKEINHDMEEIDFMEPVAFEELILNKLKTSGYRVSTTPHSHDAGADGIAIAPPNSNLPNLIIQCKHSQYAERLIGIDAIKEVVYAKTHYSVPEPVKMIVVTNVNDYTENAKIFAQEVDVLLFKRKDLMKNNFILDSLMS